jgi:hypothetical protein
MSGTTIEIRKKRISSEVHQSKHIKWTGSEKPHSLHESPFPSVESVLGDIEECLNARKFFAQRQS